MNKNKPVNKTKRELYLKGPCHGSSVSQEEFHTDIKLLLKNAKPQLFRLELRPSNTWLNSALLNSALTTFSNPLISIAYMKV